jgi:two-component system cell cycle sensor histidine kinase/response regulator CckA
MGDIHHVKTASTWIGWHIACSFIARSSAMLTSVMNNRLLVESQSVGARGASEDAGASKTPLFILHLEDSISDAALLEATLSIERINCDITVVSRKHDFQAALARPEIGLILSDFSMPNFDGFTALQVAQKLRPEVPFIFFSGTIGEELAVEALREGATDYVLKDRMARLPEAIRRALAEVEARRQRERDMEQLRNQAALLDLAQDAISVLSMDHSVLYWNKSSERLYGWNASEVMGRNAIELLLHEDPAKLQAALKTLIHDGTWQGELVKTTKDGRKITVESRWSLVRDNDGNPKSILVINTDVTEKRQIEAQFLRTQRIETIGALAGGIAHDLNNALTPVLVALQVSHDEVTSVETKKLVTIAQNSARHGVEMVKQILAFSRGVGGTEVEVQIGSLVGDIVQFVQDTFPGSIRVESKVSPSLHAVKGNATQLHQVLLNLCVNARDAMPQGGALSIEARNASVDENFARQHQVSAGKFLVLSAIDSGHGMSEEILSRIFEPFFTTKEIGKGTGLGLSTLMGIVKTHGGFVEVSSEVGKGSSFNVFLPAVTPSEITSTAAVAIPEGQQK